MFITTMRADKPVPGIPIKVNQSLIGEYSLGTGSQNLTKSSPTGSSRGTNGCVTFVVFRDESYDVESPGPDSPLSIRRQRELTQEIKLVQAKSIQSKSTSKQQN